MDQVRSDLTLTGDHPMRTTDAEWADEYFNSPRRPRLRRRPVAEPGLRQLQHIPDFPITIERVGGGAAPEGYAAMLWPDEMVAQPLDGYLHTKDFVAQGHTPEECFYYSFVVLLGQLVYEFDHRMSPEAKRILWIFAEPWARTEFYYDLDNCLLAIDTGALEH